MNDFNEYLTTLDVTAPKLTLDTVETLQRKHLANFCFNNIAVLLNRPLSLDVEQIEEKIVRKKLGGYCYEHNKLFHDVLLSLGFEVRCLIAKVINNHVIDPPRTHRITLLTFAGDQYLADVGFGPNSTRKPIKIEDGALSEQDGMTYKISATNTKEFQLELLKDEGPFVLYRFDLGQYGEADCTMGNFYSSKHPNALFVNNLIVSLILPNITLALKNNQYHKIAKESTEIIDIESTDQLKVIIRDDFNISLSDEEAQVLSSIVLTQT
jgi:N-hydroxyarylamine O-acetyltransferase